MRYRDHLIVVRMVDAPVDLHVVPSVEWAINTYGPHPLTDLVAALMSRPGHGIVMTLMMPPGADLETVIAEYHARLVNMLQRETLISLLPFTVDDVTSILDWLQEHNIRGMGVATPSSP